MKTYSSVSFLKQSSDETLVELYQQNANPQIIGILFNRHYSTVKQICLRYLKDESTSDDAAMDIFEQLVNQLKRHQIKSFKSWITCVARNFCLKSFRNKKYFQEIDKVAEVLTESPSDHSNNEEKIIALDQAIRKLKPQQQQCIELFFFQKLSYREISNLVKCDIKKVKSHIQNGKLRLKTILAA